MTTLSNLLDEYQKVYTEWCRFGMPDGIVAWRQGQGGGGFARRPKEIIDIRKCCETGKYVDTSKPWICYDKSNNHIKIYCVHWKGNIKLLFFDALSTILPKPELMTYAQQHSLSLDIIQGRSSSEGKKNADVVVLSGKHADFIKAGWENVFQAELHKKEREAEAYHQGCIDTRERIKAALPAIEKAFYSAAMETMVSYKCGHGNSAIFLSNQWCYTLYLHGVMWHNLSGASYYDPTHDYSYMPSQRFDGSWFMPFSKIGFDDLQTEEQLFCFAAAMFCRKNGISPAELNADNIIWICKIESTYKGTTINNPRFKPKEEPTKPLKPIF